MNKNIITLLLLHGSGYVPPLPQALLPTFSPPPPICPAAVITPFPHTFTPSHPLPSCNTHVSC